MCGVSCGRVLGGGGGGGGVGGAGRKRSLEGGPRSAQGFRARNICIVTPFIFLTRAQHHLFGRIWADLGPPSKLLFRPQSLGQGIFLLSPYLLEAHQHYTAVCDTSIAETTMFIVLGLHAKACDIVFRRDTGISYISAIRASRRNLRDFA